MEKWPMRFVIRLLNLCLSNVKPIQLELHPVFEILAGIPIWYRTKNFENSIYKKCFPLKGIQISLLVYGFICISLG